MAMSADAQDSRSRIEWAKQHPLVLQGKLNVPTLLKQNDVAGRYYGNMPAPTTNNQPIYSGIGGGGGGRGGWGVDPQYAASKASAQQVIDYYMKLLGNKGYVDPYRRVLRAGRKIKRKSVKQAKKFVKGERQAVAAEVARATGTINEQTAALQNYLSSTFRDPYAAPVAERVGNIDNSAALLGDQGAGTGGSAMSAAQAQAAAYNSMADRAMSDYYGTLSANANEANRMAIAAAQLSGQSRLDDLRRNQQAINSNLRGMLFGARQNALQQFGQTKLQTKAQIAQQEQQIRDMLIQLAIQYGLKVPF